MSDLIFAFNCIAPLFLMAMVGTVARTAGWIKIDQAAVMQKLCFYILLPAQLIKNMLQADFSMITDPLLYVYGIATLPMSALLLGAIVPHFMKERPRIAAFIHSSVRPNSILLGIPLAINIFGETASFPLMLMLMLLLPFSNATGIIIMAIFGGDKHKITFTELLKDIFINPLTLAILFGLLLQQLHVTLPPVLQQPLNSMAAAATPIAMLCIGVRFQLKRLSNDRRVVIWAVFLRLFGQAALFTLPLVLTGQSGMAVAAVYYINALPTGTMVSIITDMMGGDGDLAGEITLVSTAMAVFSLFLMVLAFRWTGLV